MRAAWNGHTRSADKILSRSFVAGSSELYCPSFTVSILYVCTSRTSGNVTVNNRQLHCAICLRRDKAFNCCHVTWRHCVTAGGRVSCRRTKTVRCVQLYWDTVLWTNWIKTINVLRQQCFAYKHPLLTVQERSAQCSKNSVQVQCSVSRDRRGQTRQTVSDKTRVTNNHAPVLTPWKNSHSELVLNRTETVDGRALEKPGVRPVDVSHYEHAVWRPDAIALPADVDGVSILGPVDVGRRIGDDGTLETQWLADWCRCYVWQHATSVNPWRTCSINRPITELDKGKISTDNDRGF